MYPAPDIYYVPQRSLSPICSKFDANKMHFGSFLGHYQQDACSFGNAYRWTHPVDYQVIGSHSTPFAQRYAWPVYQTHLENLSSPNQTLLGFKGYQIGKKLAPKTPRPSVSRHQLITSPPNRQFRGISPTQNRGKSDKNCADTS